MKKAIITITALLASAPAFAEEAAATVATAGIGNSALYALAAGFAIGIAALGGALAQGKIGASAVEGIARNPQSQKPMFVPMILGLVFAETLVLFAFVVANGISGKI